VTLAIDPGPLPALGELLLEERIASLPDGKERAVRVFAEALVARGWVAESERSWLQICLDEALGNALLHGNEGDPQLAIHLALYRDGDRWHLSVCDAGEGFAAEDLPDSTDAAAIGREHGRGILLMQRWLDELRYFEGGRCAVLSRRVVGT